MKKTVRKVVAYQVMGFWLDHASWGYLRRLQPEQGIAPMRGAADDIEARGRLPDPKTRHITAKFRFPFLHYSCQEPARLFWRWPM